MGNRDLTVVIEDLSGGWNATDPPHQVANNQVSSVSDMEWFQKRMPQKRKGYTADTLSPWAPSGTIEALFKHTPQGADGITAAELWAVSSDPQFGRRTNGWAQAGSGGSNQPDTLSNPDEAHFVSYRDRFMMAYDSNVDRLHLWNGTIVRRAGLPAPDPPQTADMSSGSITGTRHYKIAYVEKSGSTYVRRSELSAKKSHTPSGSPGYVEVTEPASPPNEGETHFLVYGSSDDVTYHYVSEIPVSSAEQDSNDWATYTGDAPPVVGEYTVPPSARYLAVGDARLFLARAWENDDYDSRVWWTPVFGSTGIGDEERIPTNNFVDVDPGQHGPITGIHVSPLGEILVWKATAIYRLVQTGDSLVPYRVVQLSGHIGLLHQRSVVDAVDAAGGPVVAWVSSRGAYHYGQDGIVYLGRPVEGWFESFDTGTVGRKVHGVFYAEKRQIWWFTSLLNNGSDPLNVMVFHVQFQSWTRFAGNLGKSSCSAMYAASDASGVTSPLEVPWIGRSTGTIIGKADTGLDDGGTDFSGTVTTKAYSVAPMTNLALADIQVVCPASSGATIEAVIEKDFGVETARVTDAVSLTAAGSETRVIKNFEDAFAAETQYVTVTVRDEADGEQNWGVETIAIRARPEDVRHGNRKTT